MSCDDNNPCTDDSCNPAIGCTATNDDTNLCSDGNGCTNDHCSGGACIGSAIDCDDDDPCTTDACNPLGQCVHTPTGCGSTGACCTLPGCQVTTEGMCVALGGNYAGNSVTCVAATCPTVPRLQEPGCRSSKNPLLTAPTSDPCTGRGTDCGGPVASDDPVYLFSGEFYQSDVDLRIPGRGPDLVWARKYRSRLGSSTPLGNGWDFSYNIALAEQAASRPSEVLSARFPNKQTLTWDQPTDPGGPVIDLRYCTLRSTDRSNFASGATTIFVESDGVDQTSTDAANPVPGGVFYYLISAKNANGEGTLGSDSHLDPRAGLPCGSPQGDFVLFDGDARRDILELQPDGSRTAAELFQVLTSNPDGSYTLTFPDRGTWNFHAFDHSRRAGKISSIADRNGNTLTFQHDSQGRLVTVTDTLARNTQVAYGANGLIASVTDFAGRQVLYAYYNNGDAGGSFGDLKSVTTPAVTGTPTGNDFPTGKTTTYTYSKGFADEARNHNLLTITDPKGQMRLTNVYSTESNPALLNFDRVTRQVWGNPGDIIDYVYVAQSPSVANNYASLTTIVNDRVGNVKEYFFNAANRDVMLREFTGRADPDQPTTESLNRPTGQLRLDDPPFFETRWGYNKDAQPTAVMNPNSSQESMTYDPGNASRRSQANLLERCMLAGPGGGDQAQICETFEYDAGFGGCCGGNFVTRHVNGRGDETLHTYDGNGNRLHTQYPIPSVVEDYVYNAFGQLTAHVLPDNGSGHRQRNEYAYYASGPQRGYLHQTIGDATGFALTTTHEYDAIGNVTRTTDPRGNDTLYTVNQRNQTVRETSREVVLGSGIRYRKDTFYDANDNVVRTDVQNVAADGVVQPNANFTTVNEYEILDKPVKTCREVNSYSGAIPGTPGLPTCTGLPAAQFMTEELHYDANRNLILVRHGEAAEGRQPTNVTATQYDERDLVFRVVQAPGDAGQSSTQRDYDASRNLKKVSQGLENNPRVSLDSYDGYNRLAATTDAMGNATSLRYDPESNLISYLTEGELIDVSGASGNVRLTEITYVYDAMNRVVREEKEFFDPATQAPIGMAVRSPRPSTLPAPRRSASWTTTAMRRCTSTTTRTASSRSPTPRATPRPSTTTPTPTNSASPSSNCPIWGALPRFSVTTNTYDNLDRVTTTTDNIGNQQEYGTTHVTTGLRKRMPRATRYATCTTA
jgi:YD repeat-containing protein